MQIVCRAARPDVPVMVHPIVLMVERLQLISGQGEAAKTMSARVVAYRFARGGQAMPEAAPTRTSDGC